MSIGIHFPENVIDSEHLPELNKIIFSVEKIERK